MKLRTLWRGVRFVLQDRVDTVSAVGLGAIGAGTWKEFGWGWASIATGVVLLLFVWKGLR